MVTKKGAKVTGELSDNGHDSSQMLRSLPSVDRVIEHADMAEAREQLPHAIVADAARAEVDSAREAILGGGRAQSLAEIAVAAARRAWEMTSPSLRPVINATGVIIHTNLGRAPLSAATLEAMQRVASYSNLEYDL